MKLGMMPRGWMAGSPVPSPPRGPLRRSLPLPRRPRLACRSLQALDEFARENIYALYKFNFSRSGDAPCPQAPGPESTFQLDRTVRLQRLSGPGSQNKVGFRLVSVLRGALWWAWAKVAAAGLC